MFVMAKIPQSGEVNVEFEDGSTASSIRATGFSNFRVREVIIPQQIEREFFSRCVMLSDIACKKDSRFEGYRLIIPPFLLLVTSLASTNGF
jgi:hypothetical protein